MKGILLAVITMLALPAFAATKQIEHDYYEALRGLEIDNVCLTDTTIRSLTPTRTCTRYEERASVGGDGVITEQVCVETVTTQKNYSRQFMRRGCAEFRQIHGGDIQMEECVRSSWTPEYLPDSIDVRVVTSYGETDNWPGRAQRFTFPRCNE